MEPFKWPARISWIREEWSPNAHGDEPYRGKTSIDDTPAEASLRSLGVSAKRPSHILGKKNTHNRNKPPQNYRSHIPYPTLAVSLKHQWSMVNCFYLLETPLPSNPHKLGALRVLHFWMSSSPVPPRLAVLPRDRQVPQDAKLHEALRLATAGRTSAQARAKVGATFEAAEGSPRLDDPAMIQWETHPRLSQMDGPHPHPNTGGLHFHILHELGEGWQGKDQEPWSDFQGSALSVNMC